MKKSMLCLVILLCGCHAAASATAQTGTDTPADEDAIRACVLDYLEGWFSSDAERMERALHSSLFKCRVVKVPGSDAEVLDLVDASTMITYAANNQSWVADKEGFQEMKILFNDGRIAVVHAVSDDFYDVIGLIKENGDWKILQVLWDVNQD